MGKPRILVTHPLVFLTDEDLTRRFDIRQLDSELPIGGEQLKHELAGKDGAVCFLIDRFSADVLQATNDLKVISSVSAGLDHIDLAEATARGIYVTNTPTALTNSVAEFAIAIMLALSRRITEADAIVRSGQWKGGWGLTYMLGSELKGKSVGIIGLGRIGTAVAKKLGAFDVSLSYCSRTRKIEAEQSLGIRYLALDDLLSISDYVIICVSLSDQTRGMIGERELLLMRESAYLVNVSRGQVIDEASLVKVLREKKIAGAALDVFEKEPIGNDHPLAQLKNVFLSPHIGSATKEARRAMVLDAIENLTAIFEGIEAPNIANPEVMKRRPLKVVKML